MFAPYPKKSDGWLVIPGVTEDGELVNVFDAEGEADVREARKYVRQFLQQLIDGESS